MRSRRGRSSQQRPGRIGILPVVRPAVVLDPLGLDLEGFGVYEGLRIDPDLPPALMELVKQARSNLTWVLRTKQKRL